MKKLKRVLVLLFGGAVVLVFSILSYVVYEYIFHNKEILMTAWAVTLGVFNAFFSPAKFLTIFRA